MKTILQETKFVDVVEVDGKLFVESYSEDNSGKRSGEADRYPVKETLHDCELTATGWRGTMSNGEVIECRQDASILNGPADSWPRKLIYARMYDDKREPMGIYLLDWKPAQQAA